MVDVLNRAGPPLMPGTAWLLLAPEKGRLIRRQAVAARTTTQAEALTLSALLARRNAKELRMHAKQEPKKKKSANAAQSTQVRSNTSEAAARAQIR